MSDAWRVEIEGLERAQAGLRVLFYAARPEGKLPSLVHAATLQASVEASRLSPRLTGTLAAAHRERMVSPRVGEVYIDPTTVNPVLGGRPSIYGPVVHDMGYPRNWMERTSIEKGAKIVARATQYWAADALPGL